MASAQPTTDHETIRRWAEERGGKPACVRGTGGGEDVGMIRLDFPGYSGAESLEPISWEEWFQAFDENGLALLIQEETAGGEPSHFNKLVKRETAGSSEGEGSSEGGTASSGGRARRASGESSRGRASAGTARSTSGRA